MKFLSKKNGGLRKDKPIVPIIGMKEMIRDDAIRFEDTLIMMNDGVNICAEACASCWDTKLPSSYEEKVVYISKRTKIGHTSVIEHSNTVFMMCIDLNKDIEDLAVFLSECRYLHTCFKISKKNPTIGYLLIGGSWRAFSDLFYISSNLSNKIMIRVISLIRKYIPHCGMSDIINIGMLEKEDFIESFNTETYSIPFRKFEKRTNIDEEFLDCLNCDDINVLKTMINKYCDEPELFTTFDLLDFCTITILFKKMSRIITQQLTRHRNGITQESQRYVNYSKACFNSPAEFKDRYDPNHKYDIYFGSTRVKLNLQELGDMMVKVYSQLTDTSHPMNKQYALLNEDARGYLPGNTQCNKVYITFTWRTFFKFLQLREDSHAQAEFRQYALILGEWFREEYPEYSNLYNALIPRSINQDTIFMSTIADDYTSLNSQLITETEYIEVMAEAASNFDETKVDPEEVEQVEPNLKHGEI